MTYVLPNFKTKKALKAALSAGEHIDVFEPGAGTIPQDGKVYLEGPHYPKPHMWYATGIMQGGKLTRISG